MHAVEHHVDRGRGRRVVLEYSVALLGPEDFSAWDLPTKAASAAQPLRLCQIGPALPQGAFSSLLILDIEADSIPFDDISPVAAQRYAARHMPAVFAVAASNTQVHLECLSTCQASAPLVLACFELIGMDRARPGGAFCFLLREAGIVAPRSIDEIARAVGLIACDQCRDRVDRRLKLAFGLAGFLFRALPFGAFDLQGGIEFLKIPDLIFHISARPPKGRCGISLHGNQSNDKQGRRHEQGDAR